MKKYGLALSGGAARGAAHLGVLKALDEKDIKPQLLSGTSAGAMVGCFYADGYAPDEILDLIESESLFKKISFKIPHKGFLSFGKLKDFINANLRTKNIEDFPIPIYIGTTNFLQGELEYFSQGPVIQALEATSAVPGIFQPAKIDNQFYYDGGLISNLPVEPLLNQSDILIGSNVNPLLPADYLGSFQEIIIRTTLIGVAANVETNKRKCDIYLEPEQLNDFSLTDNSHYREMYKIGYEYALEKIK